MKPLLSAIALTAALIGAQAHAACTIASGAGLWSAYSASRGSTTLNYTRCTLTIGKAGKIIGACYVTDDQGTHLPQAHATGSLSLQLSSFCQYTGQLTLDNGSGTNYIDQVTLSEDKYAASGVGHNGPVNFILNMIKIRG